MALLAIAALTAICGEVTGNISSTLAPAQPASNPAAANLPPRAAQILQEAWKKYFKKARRPTMKDVFAVVWNLKTER